MLCLTSFLRKVGVEETGKMLRKKIILTAFLLNVGISIFSNTESIILLESSTDKLYEENSEEKNSNISKDLELKIEVLTESVKIYKESFDRITASYNWSIGIIITMIVAFLGVTGYNYHRNYKKELSEILNQIQLENQKIIETLEKENQENILKNQKKLKDEMIKENKKLELQFLEEVYKTSSSQKLYLTYKILLYLSELYGERTESYDFKFYQYISAMKNLLEQGEKFERNEYTDVKKMLEKLPIRFNDEKENLKKLLTIK